MNDLLNLNIYFDENYWLEGRKLVDANFYQSSIFNKYYRYLYRKQKPLNNKFIKSGPQKLVNNTIKAFIGKSDVTFNRNTFDNYYFCTYSKQQKNLLISILERKKKVLVGPLYTIEDFLVLVDLAQKYKNLKIVSASHIARKTMLKIANLDVNNDIIKILPVGINSDTQILKNKNKSKIIKDNDCLIYLKGQKETELRGILKTLRSKNKSYKIFEYGKYSNSKLMSIANSSKFGIVLGRTESQGIGINELMSTNLPLFVIDSLENHFNNNVYEGTTVPYWDETCGMKIESIENFDNNFSQFLINVGKQKYQPHQFIIDTLSYEAMYENLKKLFKDISF